MKCHVVQLTKGESAYIQNLLAAYGKRSFRVKKCWSNAQRLMLYDDENRLRYWEGFKDACIPHAWVTVSGKVVDVTHEAQKRLGYVAKNQVPSYEGIRINRRTQRRAMLRTNQYGPVATFYTPEGLLLEKGALGDDFRIIQPGQPDPNVCKQPSTVFGCIPAASFRSFRQMREKLKKPLSGPALAEMVKKLKQFHAEGHDIGALLDQSTRQP